MIKFYLLIPIIFLGSIQLHSQMKIGEDINGTGNYFGFSISLSEDGKRIAITEHGEDLNFDLTTLRMFEWRTNEWQQIGDGITTNAFMRTTLTDDGRKTVVRSVDTDTGEHYVSVYYWDDFGAPVKIGNDINLGVDMTTNGDNFFSTIAISPNGEKIAHGYFDETYFGIVIVYEWINGTWVSSTAALHEELFAEYGANIAFSADGNRLAVSSGKSSTAVKKRVRIYERDPSGWVQFGNTIELSNTYFRINALDLSADGNTVMMINASSMHTYGYIDSEWTEIGFPGLNDTYSCALSNDGQHLIRGYWGGNNMVRARYYKLEDDNWERKGVEIENGFDPWLEVPVAISGDAKTFAVSSYGDKYVSVYAFSPTNTTEIITTNQVSIFPNPTNGDCTMLTNFIEEKITVTIRNNMGQRLFAKKFENVDKINFNLDDNLFPPGLYFIEIKNATGASATTKVVKQ